MDTYTLTELVERSGYSARTIRFYTGCGLLDPPERVGRRAQYDERHLARLDLVRTLQQQGLTLAAIAGYVERLPPGASAQEVALHRTLLSPWSLGPRERLTRAELGERAGRRLTAGDLEVLETLDIIVAVRGGYDVATGLLASGLALIDLGLPVEAAAQSQRILATHGRALAEDLTEVFRSRVWPSYKRSELPPEALHSLAQHFEPFCAAAVLAHFSAAVNDVKKETVERRSRPRSGGSDTTTQGAR